MRCSLKSDERQALCAFGKVSWRTVANGQSVCHRVHYEAGDGAALLFRGEPDLVGFFRGAVNEQGSLPSPVF